MEKKIETSKLLIDIYVKMDRQKEQEKQQREQELQKFEERAREEYNKRVLSQLRLYEEKKAAEEGQKEQRKLTK